MHSTQVRQLHKKVVAKCHQGRQTKLYRPSFTVGMGRDVQHIRASTVKISFLANGYPV